MSRPPFRIELDKFVGAGRYLRHGRLTIQNRVCYAARIELIGAHRIVVTWNHIIYVGRRTICIDNRHHGNFQFAGLFDRDFFVCHIDHEHCIGQRTHVLYAAETPLELEHLALQAQHLFLAQLLKRSVAFHFLEIFEAFDRLPDGLEVGQHAAQPAMAYIGHATALRFCTNCVAGRSFCSHEQDLAAVSNHGTNELCCLLVQRQRSLEIDDMNLVTFAEDVRRHFRVPVAGLMSEMNARFQHLAHGKASHF